MKKFLLATSSLFTVFAVSVSIAQAEPEKKKIGALEFEIGGFMDFQTGLLDQDYPYDFDTRNHHFSNDTEIHFNISSVSSSGLEYGAVIELEADVNDDYDALYGLGEGQNNSDKTYLFLENNTGRIELGSTSGPQETMKIDASTIARATGGIDGDWYRYAYIASGITRPSLPSAHYRDQSDDANKIVYYTPSFNGVRAGASYTPSEGDYGTSASFDDSVFENQENVFGYGIDYTGDLNGVGIKASVTAEVSNSRDLLFEDINAYALGLSLDYKGFSVAGSWGDWGNSGKFVGQNEKDGYWTLGAAYKNGPYGASVTYFDSSFEFFSNDDASVKNLSIGADYELAPGLVPYLEVSFFEFSDDVFTGLNNNGSVILTGIQLNF